MQFLLLIYTPEEQYQNLPAETLAKYQAEHWQLRQDVEAAGVYQGAERLRPVEEAKSVRMRNGEFVISDGPFAETKEQLGGFYMVDVPTVEDAITWAKRIPQTDESIIEVRPVWVMQWPPAAS